MTIMEKLPVEFKEKWINALRSGEYIQGNNHLVRFDPFLQKPTYCCLGVACIIAGLTNEQINMGGYIDNVLQERIPGVDIQSLVPAPLYGDGHNGIVKMLSTMNDGEGDFRGDRKNFDEIADWIEENL